MVERRRGAAEDAMLSRCRVRRKHPSDTTVVDGLHVPVWSTVYDDLPVKIAGGRGDGAFRLVRIGDAETAVAARTAKMPAGTADLVDDDLLEVYLSEAGQKVYRVLEASWQDQATARRVPVVEVDRPAEWGPWS